MNLDVKLGLALLLGRTQTQEQSYGHKVQTTSVNSRASLSLQGPDRIAARGRPRLGHVEHSPSGSSEHASRRGLRLDVWSVHLRALPGVDDEEVTVLEIHVAAEDRIQKEQTFITVETAETVVDLPAPAVDVVHAVAVEAGERIIAGALLLTLT